MNSFISRLFTLRTATSTKEYCLQSDSQQHELSLEDQSKLNWLACYLLSYKFLESEKGEIEKISKELGTDFKQTGIKLAIEFIQSCRNTLSAAESEMLLLNLEDSDLLLSLKTKIYQIRKENIGKYGISLSEDQKSILKKIKKTTKEFNGLLVDFTKNLNQLQSSNMVSVSGGNKNQYQKSENNEGGDWSFFFKILSSLGLIGMLVSGFFMFAGFGTAGIYAKSFAAYWQAYIGNVEAGSLFSILQSLGMKGIFWKVFIVSFIAAGAGYSQWFKDN